MSPTQTVLLLLLLLLQANFIADVKHLTSAAAL